MSSLRIDQLITCGVLCVTILVPGKAVVAESIESKTLALQTIAPVPVLISELRPDMNNFVATLSARSIVIVDVPSAAILVEKNAHEPVSPASTTKMMTALVTRQLYDLDEVVTIREEAFSIGHTVGFEVNEQLTVRDLLASLLINSGNDAAFALANHHPLGYDTFVAEMNKKADELHLSQTSFRNPSGLDDAAHYSTSRDLGILAREVMKDPILSELVATKRKTISDVTGTIHHTLTNTNELLFTEPGIVGIKTGTTELAKESLVIAVDRNEKKYVAVILGSDDRYQDSRQLLQWVENYYIWTPIDESRLQLEKPQ